MATNLPAVASTRWRLSIVKVRKSLLEDTTYNDYFAVAAFIAIISMCIRVVVRGLPLIFRDLASLVLQSALL